MIASIEEPIVDHVMVLVYTVLFLTYLWHKLCQPDKKSYPGGSQLSPYSTFTLKEDNMAPRLAVA